MLAFTVKEGDGDAWTTEKLDRPRHFTFWREQPFTALLAQTGWTLRRLLHVPEESTDWIYVVCTPSDPART